MQEKVVSAMLPSKLNIFEKIAQGIKKITVPTQIGFNQFLISLKRKSLLKIYEQYSSRKENDLKKDELYKRLNEMYIEYLETLDKYIMDSVYKRVRLGKASDFDKKAMSNYYKITVYKKDEFTEYKFRKQRFLLELDYIYLLKKGILEEKHEKFYAEKQTIIHRSLLKNYALKLNSVSSEKRSTMLRTYVNIFTCIEDYMDKIFPIFIKYDNENQYKSYMPDYVEYQKFSVGKLDEKNYLEKNLLLLSLSSAMFTHSLSFQVKEMCYNKLLLDTRMLLINSKNENKKEKAFEMILMIIRDKSSKLLKNKIVWEDKEERKNFEEFWTRYLNSETPEKENILMIKEELREVKKNPQKYKELLKFYKEKLVKYNALRKVKLGKTNKVYKRKYRLKAI